LVKGKRLKLFYAAQTTGDTKPPPMEDNAPEMLELGQATQTARKARGNSPLQPPEFILFVNDPRVMTETYRRYLEARIREAEPYPGLPIILTLRARAGDGARR
jgi:predicted GTPase